MKTNHVLITLAAALALGLTGCGKNESPAPMADDASRAPASAADAVTSTGDAAKAEAAKSVDAVKATASTNAQGLIDKAKSLIAEQKYSDAAGILQQLAGQPLSAEQKTLVESLKEQIQKALSAKAAGNASGSLDNLLKK